MLKDNTIKEIHGLKYYTGLHSKMRDFFKKGKRPTDFGDKVWATSIVMINHFEENSFDLEKLKVLEIGCGQGILGLYLAQKYSCDVTCSDFDELVLPIVQLHASLNKLSVKTKRFAFEDISTEDLKDIDVIIGSEVCYSEVVGKEIIKLTDRAFETGVSRIIIGDPGRPDFEDFQEVCAKKYNTDLVKLPGSSNGKTTNLFSIYK